MEPTAKQALSTSLEKLVTNMSFDDISVKLIVSKTTFNRQTFYYHFQDKFDCLQYTLEQLSQRLAAEMIYSDWRKCYLKIFNVIAQRRTFMGHIVNSQAYSMFTDFVLQSVDAMLQGVLARTPQGETQTSFPQKPWKLFEYGLQGIIIDWFTEGLRKEPEELADELLDVDISQLKVLLGTQKQNLQRQNFPRQLPVTARLR